MCQITERILEEILSSIPNTHFFTSIADAETTLTQERDLKAEILDKKDNLEFQVEETSSKLEELEKNLNSSKTYVEQLEEEKKLLKAKVESLLREASEKELKALSSEKTSDGLLQGEIEQSNRGIFF